MSALPPLPPPDAHTVGSTANVMCGDVITADTTLTTDLNCSGDGLIIAASITLDLAGHTIAGSGVGLGISVYPGWVVTIKNGTVHDFGLGIRVYDSGNGATVTISTVTVTRNGDIGIYLGGDSYGDTVSDSTISLNGGDGIQTQYANDGTVFRHNHVIGNGGNGISTTSATSSFFGNDVRRNRGYGIVSSELVWFFAPFYQYKGNTVDRNGQEGIRLAISGPDTPQPVDDQGGNEAKLNVGPQQCDAFGLTCGFTAK